MRERVSDDRLWAEIDRARADAGAARRRAVGSRRPEVHKVVAGRYDDLAALLAELAEHRAREADLVPEWAASTSPGFVLASFDEQSAREQGGVFLRRYVGPWEVIDGE